MQLSSSSSRVRDRLPRQLAFPPLLGRFGTAPRAEVTSGGERGAGRAGDKGCLAVVWSVEHEIISSDRFSLRSWTAANPLRRFLTGAEGGASSGGQNSRVSSSSAQVAVQSSGLLRNLAATSAHAGAFAEGGNLSEAAAASLAQWAGAHGEVALNLTRVLAKLSLLPACAEGMAQEGAEGKAHGGLMRQLIDVLAGRPMDRAIVLRAAFVLGNLTTDSNEARERVGALAGSVATLVGLLETYLQEPSAPRSPHLDLPPLSPRPSLRCPLPSPLTTSIHRPTSPSPSPRFPHSPMRLLRSKEPSKRATREEVLVKVVRLLANLAMDPNLGPDIASEPSVASCLLDILQQHTLEDAEELVLNCTALATNLSFYSTPSNRILNGRPPSPSPHRPPHFLISSPLSSLPPPIRHSRPSRTEWIPPSPLSSPASPLYRPPPRGPLHVAAC